MPFGVHPIWLIVLLAIVLIIFGPGKLPELGGAVGRGIREFQKASREVTDSVKDAVAERDEPKPGSNTTTTTASVEPGKSEPEK